MEYVQLNIFHIMCSKLSCKVKTITHLIHNIYIQITVHNILEFMLQKTDEFSLLRYKRNAATKINQ